MVRIEQINFLESPSPSFYNAIRQQHASRGLERMVTWIDEENEDGRGQCNLQPLAVPMRLS